MPLEPDAVSLVEHGIEAGPLPAGTPCAGTSIRLDRVDGGPVRVRADGLTLALEVDLDLAAGTEQAVLFRFGLATGDEVPPDCCDDSLRNVAAWLPQGDRELAWHAALLAGGACTDGVPALSVLRNTCAWGSPDGDLPYALDGRRQPWTDLFRPSDQNLWALWLAAEYAAATGDLAAFAEPVGYHPRHGASPGAAG